jgi:hypothetical protein
MKLVPPDNPVALAAAIDAWLAFPEHLKLARQAATRATKETYCWNASENSSSTKPPCSRRLSRQPSPVAPLQLRHNLAPLSG